LEKSESLQDLVEGAAVLKPETGLGPKVYYRNIPRQVYLPVRYTIRLKRMLLRAPNAIYFRLKGMGYANIMISVISGSRTFRLVFFDLTISAPRICSLKFLETCALLTISTLATSPWTGNNKVLLSECYMKILTPDMG
jgi:hypothetical protein